MNEIIIKHPSLKNLKLVKSTYTKQNALQLLRVIKSFENTIDPNIIGPWVKDIDFEGVAKHLKNIDHVNNCDFFIVNEQQIIGKLSNEIRENKQYFIGYYLHQEYWGQNIMTCALKQLIKIDKNVCGVKIRTDNVGSIKVVQNCGFEFSSCEDNWNYYTYKQS